MAFSNFAVRYGPVEYGDTMSHDATVPAALDRWVPHELLELQDLSRDLPRLARDNAAMDQIRAAVLQVPTRHQLRHGDARCRRAR